jgi:hypothetical protein
MQGTHIDRDDRPADDVVPPAGIGDTAVHDLFELWQDTGGSD